MENKKRKQQTWHHNVLRDSKMVYVIFTSRSFCRPQNLRVQGTVGMWITMFIMLKLKTTAIYRQKTQHFVGLWHSHWNDIWIYFNGNVISMWFLDNHRCLGSMEDWCHQDHGSFLCVPLKQFRKI
jgi:hypothetical protein